MSWARHAGAGCYARWVLWSDRHVDPHSAAWGRELVEDRPHPGERQARWSRGDAVAQGEHGDPNNRHEGPRLQNQLSPGRRETDTCTHALPAPPAPACAAATQTRGPDVPVCSSLPCPSLPPPPPAPFACVQVVKDPQDLGSILQRLTSSPRAYRDPSQAADDVRTMFANCRCVLGAGRGAGVVEQALAPVNEPVASHKGPPGAAVWHSRCRRVNAVWGYCAALGRWPCFAGIDGA